MKKDFYVVRWVKDQQVIAEQRFEHLGDAKQQAHERLPVHRARRGATGVLVVDDDGVEYLRT